MFSSLSFTETENENGVKEKLKNGGNKGKVIMGEDNRPSFFKIVFSDASNERLRIPSDFLKHISNKESDRATLKVCSGCSWNAKVSKKSNGVFIEDGWPEFLKDNSLGNNEFLVLTYEGNMCFGVQIFEVNGLERLNVPLTRTHQVPFASTSSKRLQGSPKHSTTISQPLASTSTSQRHRGRPRKHQPCTQHLRPSPISCEEDGSGKNRACSVSNKATKSKAEKGKVIKIEPEEEDQPVHSLSKDDQAKDQKATESFKSKFPYFTSRVQRYYVHVPAFFSKVHLPRKKYEIVLRNLKGNSWVVNVVPTSRGHILSGGWYAFAKHNKIKNNVLCTFELVDKLEMKVHLPLTRTHQVPFASTSSKRLQGRPKHLTTTTSQSLASTSTTQKPGGRPRKHQPCTQHLLPSPKSCEEDGSGKNRACFESNKATKSKAEKCKEIKIESEDENQPVHSLSKDNRAKDLKATEAFKSKFPHFTSRVQRYYVHVPAFFSKAHLPRQKYEIVLRNLKGNSWVVNVVPTSRGHVLSGGRYAFAKHNKIKNSVLCIFELVDKLEMKVHIPVN